MSRKGVVIADSGRQCAAVSGVRLRWLVRRDVPAAHAIEAQSFERPWSEEEFLRCLQQQDCVSMVAERHGQIIGFMVYELGRDGVRILNMAVSESCRRSGVGTQMLGSLLGKPAAGRRNDVTTIVREHNLGAQSSLRATSSARSRPCAISMPRRRRMPT